MARVQQHWHETSSTHIIKSEQKKNELNVSLSHCKRSPTEAICSLKLLSTIECVCYALALASHSFGPSSIFVIYGRAFYLRMCFNFINNILSGNMLTEKLFFSHYLQRFYCYLIQQQPELRLFGSSVFEFNCRLFSVSLSFLRFNFIRVRRFFSGLFGYVSIICWNSSLKIQELPF